MRGDGERRGERGADGSSGNGTASSGCSGAYAVQQVHREENVREGCATMRAATKNPNVAAHALLSLAHYTDNRKQ